MPIGRHYQLLKAYDKLGSHLFGPEWQHDEFCSTTELTPADEAGRKRHRLQNLIHKNGDRLNELFAAKTKESSPAILTAIESEIMPLSAQYKAHFAELEKLPEPTEGYAQQAAKSRRHKAAYETLLAALQESKVRAILSNIMLIEPHLWLPDAGIRILLEYSMVIIPRRHHTYRRGAVFIDRTDFDTWLASIQPLYESAPPIDFQAQCRAWFSDEVKGRQTPMKKADYLLQVKQRFPSLSERAAIKIWDRTIPVSWTKSGPRPKM